ncbi:hypothetical protein ACFKHW_30360 [Bradyrhizobium lupini]|uniref:hypothetical protein n=1 Tax=Rhizobium lupini TaxID=136996 RepID=UPI00366F9495
MGRNGEVDNDAFRSHTRGSRQNSPERTLPVPGRIARAQAINVGGSFEPGLQIDALLVANTSWLRAILWAFVFALREETLEAAGSNPMPLVLLDDPPVTFDPRNKRKWAQEIAHLANAGPTDPFGMHLIITTHERQFFQFLVDEHLLSRQQGLVAPLNKASPVASLVRPSVVASWANFKLAFDNSSSISFCFVTSRRTPTISASGPGRRDPVEARGAFAHASLEKRRIAKWDALNHWPACQQSPISLQDADPALGAYVE